MATTAGALSQASVGSTTASLSSAAATGGTGPYTYQWYRSTTTGFSPGGGNIITGATSLTLNDSGLIPNTAYFYKVVATDSGSVASTSSQLAVSTTQPVLSQNAFSQSPFLGIVDMKVGSTNVIGAQVDASIGTALLYPGQAVKIVANTKGGAPKVIPCSSKSDQAIGFVIFNIKDISYSAGMNIEVALWGTVIWCYATGAITQWAQACLDTTTVGGVQATGATATIMGTAMDGAASAGTLIRVLLVPNAGFTTA